MMKYEKPPQSGKDSLGRESKEQKNTIQKRQKPE